MSVGRLEGCEHLLHTTAAPQEVQCVRVEHSRARAAARRHGCCRELLGEVGVEPVVGGHRRRQIDFGIGRLVGVTPQQTEANRVDRFGAVGHGHRLDNAGAQPAKRRLADGLAGGLRVQRMTDRDNPIGGSPRDQSAGQGLVDGGGCDEPSQAFTADGLGHRHDVENLAHAVGNGPDLTINQIPQRRWHRRGHVPVPLIRTVHQPARVDFVCHKMLQEQRIAAGP